MQQFVETKLVSLIKESTQRNVSEEEWEQSYDAFASALFAAKAKMERLAFHNSLCYAKAELVFWRSQSGLKKK
ncbi:hypothetical protein FACS189437_01670 [Bacteroidia bacterium]|nr:hypothetical protein FACS189437_01670 [Bacteroidia bacterium]